MKTANQKSLENLSVFCHLSGIISIFLGMLVIFMDLTNRDFKHIQVGLYIFAIGYTFTKISAKITAIIQSERNQ